MLLFFPYKGRQPPYPYLEVQEKVTLVHVNSFHWILSLVVQTALWFVSFYILI